MKISPLSGSMEMLHCIHMVNLRDVDLNLLVIFEALLEDRNVTRAAKRVGLSQAAMSNALNRLRTNFNDPLFIKTPEGMSPTSRAKDLEAPVRDALKTIRAALKPNAPFDPKTSNHTFRLAMTDYADYLLLPKVLAWAEKHASGIHIDVYPMKEEIPRHDLENGKIDVAIGNFSEATGNLYQQELFEEDFVCVMRKNHPTFRLGHAMTTAQYTTLKHLIVSPWGGLAGLADVQLNKEGLKRNVQASTPHFMVSPAVIAKTNYIVALPRRIAEELSSQNELVTVEHPIRLPRFPIVQLWHERTHKEPAQQWLRTQVFALMGAEEKMKKAA